MSSIDQSDQETQVKLYKVVKQNGKDNYSEEELFQKFPILKDNGERAFVKAYIKLAPNLDKADELVRKFSETENEVDSIDCFIKRIEFLNGLYPYRKVAACDPPDAKDIDKIRVDYYGLLAPVIRYR